MSDIRCLDTSAWLAYYFAQNEEIKKIIEGMFPLITSTLSLYEMKKRLLSLKKNPEELLNFVKQRSGIMAPEITVAEMAAEISMEKKLGAMDALIYATAMLHEAELITADNDFRGLPNVKIIS